MGKIHDRIIKKQIMKHCADTFTNAGPRGGVTVEYTRGGDLIEFTNLAIADMGMTKKEVLRSVKVKGHYDGLCNVTACQSPNNVHYYNHIMHAFYCPHCTADINRSNAYHKDVDDGKPFINFKTKEEAALLHVRNR